MKTTFRIWYCTLLSIIFLNGLFGQIKPSVLLAGFKEEVIVENINAATAFTILPDGRVLYIDQTGLLFVIIDKKVLPEPALDITAKVDNYWERGLIGVTFDRDFPQSPYLYIVYVAKDPYTHHVVSRFTLEGNTVDLNSELVLMRGDNQAYLGGYVPAGHQGGPIIHGPDGKLYIGLGEQTHHKASQAIDTLQGKILRINTDGSIPKDNPFYKQTFGKYRSIWVNGIRNPWGMIYKPGTSRLFEADVGQVSFEEINEIFRGHNYGWPYAEGMSEDPQYVNPTYAYPPSIGRSICGLVFYPESGNFPDRFKGKLIFTDWVANWVWAMDVENPDDIIELGTGLDKPVWVDVHPDGSLWLMNRGTIWRDGNRYVENTGNLVRISYVGGDTEVVKEEPIPATLSEINLFSDLSKLKPAKGVIPFSMNAPAWYPGVLQRNWMRIPEGTQIHFSEHEDWVFPKGAVLVQHYDNLKGDAFETHVFWSHGDGTYRAVAYHWDEALQGASLVESTILSTLKNDTAINWFSPGPMERLDPKLSLVGFAPQFNTRQLNVGNQLSDWSKQSLLDTKIAKRDLDSLPRLAGLDQEDASLELKVRSYLDANCASCHYPGGASRGYLDSRFSTPLVEQQMIGGELMAGDMEIPGAKVVIPGDPDRSILYQRMLRNDGYKMPPVSMHGVVSPALPLIKEWIEKLDTQ